ncbi:hypothetical protein ACJX0J_031168, partial [Zea mays]
CASHAGIFGFLAMENPVKFMGIKEIFLGMGSTQIGSIQVWIALCVGCIKMPLSIKSIYVGNLREFSLLGSYFFISTGHFPLSKKLARVCDIHEQEYAASFICREAPKNSQKELK